MSISMPVYSRRAFRVTAHSLAAPGEAEANLLKQYLRPLSPIRGKVACPFA